MSHDSPHHFQGHKTSCETGDPNQPRCGIRGEPQIAFIVGMRWLPACSGLSPIGFCCVRGSRTRMQTTRETAQKALVELIRLLSDRPERCLSAFGTCVILDAVIGGYI